MVVVSLSTECICTQRSIDKFLHLNKFIELLIEKYKQSICVVLVMFLLPNISM